jgi:hypothetical protein
MVTIRVARDSGIVEKIRTAGDAGEPILIDDGEEVISIAVDSAPPMLPEPKADIWANYDPERVLEALDQATGIFDGVDIEQLLADLREQRDQDSHGRPR